MTTPFPWMRARGGSILSCAVAVPHCLRTSWREIEMTHNHKESASQTAGPYVHIGLTPNFSGIAGVYPRDLGAEMLSAKTNGARITITGRVFDGGGLVLKDALIEIWQADAQGKYNSDDFQGWGL